jgi:hypothetical protein
VISRSRCEPLTPEVVTNQQGLTSEALADLASLWRLLRDELCFPRWVPLQVFSLGLIEREFFLGFL